MAAARVDHRLGKGKQGLARAIDRQDFTFRVEENAVTTVAPGGDGLAQDRHALGGRVVGQPLQAAGQRIHDELRRGVLRLADGEFDLLVFGIRRHAGKQSAQLFERVGLKLGEMRIHVGRRMGVKRRLSPKKTCLPHEAAPCANAVHLAPAIRCLCLWLLRPGYAE
jgi:hypothetical protein